MIFPHKNAGNNLLRSILFLLVIGLFFISWSCTTGKKEKLEIGDQAPTFSVKDLSGTPINLANYKDRPVIIRFFTTDCKYCKADTPVFVEYYEKHKNKGLQLLYITTTQDKKTVENFQRELNIPFPVIIDRDKAITKLYRVKLVPQTVILDANHKIIGAILGGVARQEIDELLGSALNR